MRLRPTIILLSIFLAMQIVAVSEDSTITSEASASPLEKKAPYHGPSLRPAKTYLCKSDQAVQGGFWLSEFGPDLLVEQAGRISKEPNTTWRITIRGDSAEVIRFSGATQALEEPEIYTVGITAGGGLLLVYERPARGYSPQIITIDPKNSSFVYSTHHVNPLHNRASVWYGSCIPYL